MIVNLLHSPPKWKMMFSLLPGMLIPSGSGVFIADIALDIAFETLIPNGSDFLIADIALDIAFETLIPSGSDFLIADIALDIAFETLIPSGSDFFIADIALDIALADPKLVLDAMFSLEVAASTAVFDDGNLIAPVMSLASFRLCPMEF